MTIFNTANTAWSTGKYPLFLGQEMALHDNINQPYPQLQKLYVDLKSRDWPFDEFSLEKDRVDMMSCSKEIYDLMVKNIAYQWSADSVASRSIVQLFSPFVTNSEFAACIMQQSNSEVVHALAYSNIVRCAVPNPHDVFAEVMHNNNTLSRAENIIGYFNELEKVGSMYKLGMLSPHTNKAHFEECYSACALALVALFALERLQFPTSFAGTFAVTLSQSGFAGIEATVQKIFQEEIVHSKIDAEAIMIEMKERPDWWKAHTPIIKNILDTAMQKELEWNKYFFSEGRKVVGLTEQKNAEWAWFNALPAYELFGLTPDVIVKNNPLKFMESFIDIDAIQTANQETKGNNYLVNAIHNDLGDEDFSDML